MINKKILFLATVITTNVYAGKPPPKPAKDVVCDGCVGTTDIENGAVTNDKLSVELQQQNSELDMRVSDNATDIQTNAEVISDIPKTYYVVDAANQKVGRLVSVIDDAYFAIINSKGFMFRVDVTGVLDDSKSGGLYYTSTNCTGQVYVESQHPDGMIFVHGGGIVSYYVPIGANEMIGFQSNSYMSLPSRECLTFSTTKNVVPAYINDPAITGVPSEGYLRRLRVQLL